jgi:hypothetical protein
MTRPSSWDDSQVHAYVDGVLDADATARIAADSRSDPELAARIAGQRALRTRLRAEFDPVLAEPVPQRLLDVLAAPAADTVITPIGAARREPARAVRARWSLGQWSAIAATLVLGALLGPFVLRGPNGLPIETDQGRLVAAGYLESALSTQISGSPTDTTWRARIGMTFRATGGEYCRTFVLQVGVSGVACRRDSRWAVELLDATPAETDGFRQASSGLSPAMLGAITALGASEPLTTDQEQEGIGSGWVVPSRN